MAKKRGKKKVTRRRRRVGAMSLNASNPLVTFAPIAIGFLFGDKLNAPLDKVIPVSLDKKIVAAGQVGIGAYLSFAGKGKPSVMKKVIGGVLLGAGVKRAMTEFGVGNINGYGAVPVIGRRSMNGYGAVPVIGAGIKRMAGYAPNSQLGNYKVPKTVKVMSGIGASGSGLVNSGGGSMMQ